MLQFAALAKAADEGLPVDGYDGFQQANDRFGQQTEGLFRGRKQSLKFGDGGMSRVALDPEGLVPPPRFDGRVCRGFFHRMWKRMGCEGTAFYVGLDERTAFDGEGLLGDLDRALEVTMGVLSFEETLPEAAVALSRVLSSVPAAQVLDGSLGIFGYPVDQGPGGTEGLGELLPHHHDVGDGWPGRTR